VTTRRAFLGTVAGGFLATAAIAGAQQAGKVWRIGLLSLAASDPASAARWTAFREQLREQGYVEGQNVVFESRWGNEQVARLPSLAAELINIKVDIVVTATSEAAFAAKQATSSIPIVTATGSDLVMSSLARPGGNVTGVISLTTGLAGKRLEFLKQVLPRASRVAFLKNPADRAAALNLRETQSAAASLGIVAQGVDVRGPSDFDAVFLAMKRARIDAVILGGTTQFIGDRRHIAELAVSHRLPMMTPSREYAQAGALFSYGTDYLDLFRRAAMYVDKILKGAKPADLPIEQPTKFEFVINLKTAKALGLTIPQSILLRADEVIHP
jgi:putative ABC transport system substrate-binding protein